MTHSFKAQKFLYNYFHAIQVKYIILQKKHFLGQQYNFRIHSELHVKVVGATIKFNTMV